MGDWSMLVYLHYHFETSDYVNHPQLQRMVDLEYELTSLYQWIRKEDQITFQEAIHRLLRLFVWCLRLYTIEDTHRGGFRNLLLDGWWLEFWEIILLAAGDVERHPGLTNKLLSQVSDRPIGKDDVIHFITTILSSLHNIIHYRRR